MLDQGIRCREFHLRVQLLHLARQLLQREAAHYSQFQKQHLGQPGVSIRRQHFENLAQHQVGFHILFHSQAHLELVELLVRL